MNPTCEVFFPSNWFNAHPNEKGKHRPAYSELVKAVHGWTSSGNLWHKMDMITDRVGPHLKTRYVLQIVVPKYPEYIKPVMFGDL